MPMAGISIVLWTRWIPELEKVESNGRAQAAVHLAKALSLSLLPSPPWYSLLQMHLWDEEAANTVEGGEKDLLCSGAAQHGEVLSAE